MRNTRYLSYIQNIFIFQTTFIVQWKEGLINSGGPVRAKGFNVTLKPVNIQYSIYIEVIHVT